MTYNKHRRLAGAVRYLPEVFNVQPTADYKVFVADSARAMLDDAWLATAKQMHEAVALTVHSGPRHKRGAASYYTLPKGVEAYLLEDDSTKKDWFCRP